MSKVKSFFLDQHGCAKNQVDGEIILSRLVSLGYEQVSNAEDADLIIINSCGFIESAKKESLNSLLESRNAFPNKKIILAGCLAERYAEVFEKNLPEADGIVGNGDLSLLDKAVQIIFSKSKKRPVLLGEQKGVYCGERTRFLSFKGSAFVKITEGCDNCCSFCAIPIIRGRLRSRPIKDVVNEIKSLLEKGIFEINLIGQDLAAYGCGLEDPKHFDNKDWHSILYNDFDDAIINDKEWNRKYGNSPLYCLLEKISELKGNFWIRLLYIHPDHFNTDVLELIKKDKRILPYFDIPFQSGDDEIIHSMNRKGNSKSYIKLVKEIRTALPDSCLRTTFLTGFPGEKDENALRTVDFLKTIKSDWSGCFEYSREEDTPSYKMKGRVAHKLATNRANNLVSIQQEITQNLLRKRVGKIYDVLVEEVIANLEGTDEGLAIGRAWFEAPEVDGNVVIRYDNDDKKAVKAIVPGAVVKVKAVASSDVDIDGIYVS